MFLHQQWHWLILKLLGQFGPAVFKFYWLDGPLVSIRLITVDISINRPFTEKQDDAKMQLCMHEDFYAMWNPYFVYARMKDILAIIKCLTVL